MITEELLRKHNIKSETARYEPNDHSVTTVIIEFNDGRIETKPIPNDGESSIRAEEFIMSLVIHQERKEKIELIKSRINEE